MHKSDLVGKAKGALREIWVPSGLLFPVLLILGLPMILCWWLASPRALSGYPTVLCWTLAWARLPGTMLLSWVVPVNAIPAQGIIEQLAAYAAPLLLLGTGISLVLIKGAVPKRRAVWLGFAWSLWVLQVCGTIPMAYLWIGEP